MTNETIINVILTLVFIGIGWVWFNPFSSYQCRKEGHILHRNSQNIAVPRHGLTHCVRCGVYLGDEEFNPNVKIKGWEDEH